MAVFGDAADPCGHQRTGIDPLDPAAEDFRHAAGRHESARNHIRERVLPVAGDPGDADDLMLPHCQIDRFEIVVFAGTLRRDIFEAQHPLARRQGLGPGANDLASDHHLGELVPVGLGGRDDADQPPPAQDRDAVADLQDLVQLVRDDDGGPALFHQAAQRGEQALGFLGRQDRRRLVENQDPGIGVERLENFHPLAFADGQVADLRIGLDLETELPGNLAQTAAARREALAQRPQPLAPQNDVLQNGQIVGQREMLVDHADPGPDRGFGRSRRQRSAVDLDTAFVGQIVAEYDVHQGGLARAVLAQQGKHLPGGQRQVDPVVGCQLSEAFGNAGEL